MIGLVIIIYSGLAVYEFLPMYKQKLWKEFWLNAVLFAVSFTMIMLISLDIKIPSPEKPIREFITSIFGK